MHKECEIGNNDILKTLNSTPLARFQFKHQVHYDSDVF